MIINGKQKKIKESFSLLNHYFVEPPNLYKMTTIDGGKLANMGVYATGTFQKINAYRAYDSGEMREIFQIGHDGISLFVSAKQGAGLE